MDYTNYKVPKHVAIILDGNRRWAKEQGLEPSYGHKVGADNLQKLSKYIFSKGVKVLSVYAFSTENFKREQEEVNYLKQLFLIKFKTIAKFLDKENIKVIFSGREKPLSDEMLKQMKKIEKMTENNTKGIFNICINYGGKAEIVDAVNKIIKEGVKEVDEEIFNKYLYHDLIPVDLLIRTSGELRVSNYMLWQISYAEFYFPNVYFPAFNEKEFDKAIIEYTKRDRRFGGNSNEKKSA